MIGLGMFRVDDATAAEMPAAITIRVTNFAPIAPGILDGAQVAAGQIYRRMGVRTTWRIVPARDLSTVDHSPRPLDAGFVISLIIEPRLAHAVEPDARTVMAVAPP